MTRAGNHDIARNSRSYEALTLFYYNLYFYLHILRLGNAGLSQTVVHSIHCQGLAREYTQPSSIQTGN